MFANIQFFAVSLGFPDVCKTIVVGVIVLTPYPNLALTSTAIPNIFNQFIQGLPQHNLMTKVPISNGNQLGTLMGVVSNTIMGSTQHIYGSVKVFLATMPATKMLSPTGQNGTAYNVLGMTLTPGQVKVMIMC